MSDLLNYRPSHSATHYTPPARIDVPRTILGFVGAALGAVVGGVIYGQIHHNLHSLYVRVGAVLVAAGVTGLLGLVPVRYGKLRIGLVAASLGALVSMIALYAMWVSWVYAVLIHGSVPISPRDLALHPLGLMRVIRVLNRTGTWMYDGDVVRGPMLLVYWLCEAGFVLAAGVLIPVFGLYSSDPTCMGCGSRCRRVPGLPRFAADRQADFVPAIENREFDLLLSHAAPAHADVPELSIQLMSCPKCEQTNVLTINRVGWVADSQGRLKVAIKPLLKNLLMTTVEAERLIMACTQVKEQRAAGESPNEVTDATASKAEWVPTTPAVTDADIRGAWLTVVHYWAEWDLHNREMDKRISAIAPDYAGRMSFRSCDCDRVENRPLFEGIANVPALGCFTGGTRVKLLIGLRSEEELRRAFDEWLTELMPVSRSA